MKKHKWKVLSVLAVAILAGAFYFGGNGDVIEREGTCDLRKDTGG